VQQYNRNRIAI